MKMINKDIVSYIQGNWMKHLQYVSDISRGGKDSHCLVNIQSKMAFDFDAIVDGMSLKNKKPTSADMLDFDGQCIVFTEFKSGFHDKISEQTYIPRNCQYISNTLCPELLPYLKMCRELAKEDLRATIVKKAIETYVLLHALVMPQCCDLADDEYQKIKLVVVFDCDPNDKAIQISNKYRENTETCKNKKTLKEALKRFVNGKSTKVDDFYYDAVDVYDSFEYECLQSEC